MRIGLIVEYDGTNYGGWQRQANAPSIQGELEQALLLTTGETITVHGAGRTDAGVHAMAQAAHFDVESGILPERFCHAMNAYLPEDIRVKRSFLALDDFHARYWATAKHYRYVVQNAGIRPAIGRDYCMHISTALCIEQMRLAAAALMGTHDFASFCAANTQVKSTIRTLEKIEITRQGERFYFDFFGNGFLYNMVRILVGTLIEIGSGKWTVEDAKRILAARDRRTAGATAKAKGLYLMEVFYRENPEKQAKSSNMK